MARRKPRGSSSIRRRGHGKRKPLDRILIVCEGEKTEPDYLNQLRSRYRLPTADIEIIPNAGGGAAKSVVKEAKRRQRANKREHKKNGEPLYDEIWCVFDSENPAHNPGIFDAIKEANKAGLKIALSVPCFEYWILLHHKFDQRPYQNCSQVLQRLQELDPKYTKGSVDFSSLEKKVNEAIERARKRLERHGIDEDAPCSATEPGLSSATRVHILVEKLIKLGKDYLPY